MCATLLKTVIQCCNAARNSSALQLQNSHAWSWLRCRGVVMDYCCMLSAGTAQSFGSWCNKAEQYHQKGFVRQNAVQRTALEPYGEPIQTSKPIGTGSWHLGTLESAVRLQRCAVDTCCNITKLFIHSAFAENIQLSGVLGSLRESTKM